MINRILWKKPAMVIIAGFFIVMAGSCNQMPAQEEQPAETVVSVTTQPQEVSPYKVITPYDSTTLWGYEIHKNDKLFIRQPVIPAVQGNKGFSSQEKALKAGEFIKWKLENNIMPPSITKAELDSLQVLN